MSDTQEKVKGRASIQVTDNLVNLIPLKIEKPKAGAIQWGIMEVQELFDTWQSFLLLPEDYAIIGVFFDVRRYVWDIVVESDAIPLPPPGQMIPVLGPVYERTADGKVRLVDFGKELRETYG